MPRESFEPSLTDAKGTRDSEMWLSQVCAQVFAIFTRCALLGGLGMPGVNMHVCVCARMPHSTTHLDHSQPLPHPQLFLFIIDAHYKTFKCKSLSSNSNPNDFRRNLQMQLF